MAEGSRTGESSGGGCAEGSGEDVWLQSLLAVARAQALCGGSRGGTARPSMTREGDPPPPWSCRLRLAQAAEREPRWHKGGPRIEARIQRVPVEPQRQKGRARGRAAAAVVPKAAARTSHGEGREPRRAQSCRSSGHLRREMKSAAGL